MNRVIQWLKDHQIQFEDLGRNRIQVKGKGRFFVKDSQGETFNTKHGLLSLSLTTQQIQNIIKYQCEYIAYRFGNNFYYTESARLADADLIPLKYLGTYDDSALPKYGKVHSAIHGRYEMMNGIYDYGKWIDKAKFLNFKALALVEQNTLGGVINFQNTCLKNDIQPIIGYTATVLIQGGETYAIKLYCQNQEGWQNLLKINKEINIINDEQVIAEERLLVLGKGLTAVIVPGKHVTEQYVRNYKNSFSQVYFGLTTTEFADSSKDEDLLKCMKAYLKGEFGALLPLLSSDAYCLEKDDEHIKKILNTQGHVRFSPGLRNHHFKSQIQEFESIEGLFNAEDSRLEKVFITALKMLDQFKDECNFIIDTTQLHLPKYEMTEKEAESFSTSEELFDHLISIGFRDKFDMKVEYGSYNVTERIVKEKDIIVKGGFIDYFLILWDIVNWCKIQNIQVGPGRGSAAGCLISYLLGVVKINPLDYDLIFERFLNESRIESELPDIDLDFASDRRDEVIAYMQERYGHDYVCRVGTYSTLQMRGVLKELARSYGVKGSERYNMNLITRMIRTDNEDWAPLFKDALKNQHLKNFIVENPAIIEDARYVLNSIKACSMHACATIIVPKEGGKDIFEQIPVRKDADGMLISEWEGEELASVGFLKEDILSTKQMGKIGHIFDLVKKNHGVMLDAEEIPLDDPAVFSLFKQGFNEDVFHFGSTGLTAYLKQVQPAHIEDLIASIALYRPGAMASNAHTDFVKLRNGDIDPEYDFMLQEVTKNTLGLYAYQEQIMQAAQILGGFSLTEADGVRKAMGKKIQSKMDGYKVQFLKHAIEINKCDKDEAIAIWEKMEVFAGYGFNKSHAAAYSVIGYYCNWLKAHYPLEFWTVALSQAKDEKISNFVSEIHKSGAIKIAHPNINMSQKEFYSDQDSQTIYWNLSKIKFVGTTAAEDILAERERNGKFFSVEEFMERMKKAESTGVNIRVVKHLILTGCFDELYQIKPESIQKRFDLIEEMYTIHKKPMPPEFSANKKFDYYWAFKQDELSQIRIYNYLSLIDQSKLKSYKGDYVSVEEAQMIDGSQDVVVAGIIEEVVIRKTRKEEKEYAVITLQSEDYKIGIRAWPDSLCLYGLRDNIESSKGHLAVFRGALKYNDFVKSNEITLTKAKNNFEIFGIKDNEDISLQP